jgi:hypothetical protein
MLNPLLIQLFGRDVVDRLENAGLATDDAVAQLGPEELSTRADIAPDVARRVAALAVELCASSRPSRARRGGASRPRSTKAGARQKRRTSDKPAPADPVAPSERAAAPSGPVDPPADEEGTEIPVVQQSAGEIDAFVDEAGLIAWMFVDEAGLIAWMGFAGRSGPEGALLSSVADGILEPASPRAAAPSQPATAAPARSGAVTIEGTFWGFGSRPHGGVTVSASSDTPRPDGAADESEDSDSTLSDSDSTLSRPVPFYRRRSHDGH